MNPNPVTRHPSPVTSIDYDLIARMLNDNLDLARRMVEIGNLVMAQAALEQCVTQAKQLRALVAAPEPAAIEA